MSLLLKRNSSKYFVEAGLTILELMVVVGVFGALIGQSRKIVSQG